MRKLSELLSKQNIERLNALIPDSNGECDNGNIICLLLDSCLEDLTVVEFLLLCHLAEMLEIRHELRSPLKD